MNKIFSFILNKMSSSVDQIQEGKNIVSGKIYSHNKRNENSIKNDLSRYKLRLDIKDKAAEIYDKIGKPIKRGNNRKKLLFFCIYAAYKEKKIQIEINDIANIVDLGVKNISGALSMFSEIKTGYKVQNDFIKPEDLIPFFFHLTGLEEEYMKNVIDFTKELQDKDPNILNLLPQETISAILMYYMKINGIPYDITIFSRKINKTKNTLLNTYNLITSIDNE